MIPGCQQPGLNISRLAPPAPCKEADQWPLRPEAGSGQIALHSRFYASAFRVLARPCLGLCSPGTFFPDGMTRHHPGCCCGAAGNSERRTHDTGLNRSPSPCATDFPPDESAIPYRDTNVFWSIAPHRSSVQTGQTNGNAPATPETVVDRSQSLVW